VGEKRLFQGDKIRVRSDLPFEEVCDRVAEILDDLGEVYISSSGRITIEAPRHASSWTQVVYRGSIRERDTGDYSIRLEYEVNPSSTCMVIGIISIFLCQFIALIFLIPVMAKSKVEQSVNRCLDDIDDALNR
jgi:hypothetical protein